MKTLPWYPEQGRELDTTPLPLPSRPPRVVACLNVWNDLTALKQTVPTWIKSVDKVVVVYGPYAGTAAEPSDGTLDFLRKFKHVQVIETTGLTQCEKRTRYLQEGKAGDYLFIIDADESVTDPRALKLPMDFDVGWVQIQSPLYQRPYGQPRLIRWMDGLSYRGRHHWIYKDERLLCTHQYSGPGFANRPVSLVIQNQRRLGRQGARLAAKHDHHVAQVRHERTLTALPPYSTASDANVNGRESLRIFQYAYRDDGVAPSRFHTAINRTTPHASLFFKQRPGPFEVPTQFMAPTSSLYLKKVSEEADIAHFHCVMSLAKHARMKSRVVFHHHGSLFRANHDQYMAEAKARNALILLSNLELQTYAEGLGHYLPNTVPVARYKALRTLSQNVPFSPGRPFRVAHSPSQPHRKGTEQFLAACASLKSRGVNVEPVVIHNLPHRKALALKATCDAAFDSFWLGMQCSGIEAAAMGLPVIAGDETVAKRYVDTYGAVPYTFANNQTQLEEALHALATDEEYWMHEMTRVHWHVTEHHDESAVTLRYLDLLDTHFGWRGAGFVSQRKVVPVWGAPR